MAKSLADQDARFELVTAAHHFLLEVLPVRRPDSAFALETFAAALRRIKASSFDTELVLLRCLAVLNERIGRCIPSLLDLYLLDRSNNVADLARFTDCVARVLRHHAVSSGNVQEAIEQIRTRFQSRHCTPTFIAAGLGERLSTLGTMFKSQVGYTLTEYIRDVRLEEAAGLLATTNRSVKEVWVHVGYGHHSNFDHDFKRKFGCTPREYRSRVIRPNARALYQELHERAELEDRRRRDEAVTARVLVVDDDDTSRCSVARFLSAEGYSTTTAANGLDGLTRAERLLPEVILLDYRLGDMDGLEFLDRLRGGRCGASATVVIFTADWEVLEHTAELHAKHAIAVSKLCDLDRLKEVIHLCSMS